MKSNYSSLSIWPVNASQKPFQCRIQKATCRQVFLWLLLMVLPLATLSAQTWNGGTGNWSDASNWNPAVVPNDGLAVVLIDGGNPVNSVVTFDLVNGFVGQLTLDLGDALNVAPSTTLTGGQIYVSGTLNNAGFINATGGIVNANLLNNNAGVIWALGLDNSGTINNSSGSILFGGLDGPVWNNSSTITNYGILRKDSGGAFYNSGTINNFSSIANPGTGFVNSGTIDNHSALQTAMANYGTFVNEAGAYLYSSGTVNYGLFSNAGLINDYNGLYNYGTFNNSGTINTVVGIDSEGGTATNSGTINSAGNTFVVMLDNFGTINNSQDFTAVALNNSGTINNTSGSSGFFSAFTLNNSGTLYNYSGSTLYNSGTIINTGLLVVAPGALVDNTNSSAPVSYTQSAGSTIVDGVFSSVAAIQINGGTLSGSGTIQGDVMMGGTLSPGDSPGVLTIQGNYTQLAGGTFFAELAGLTPGTQYDQLAVSGTVTLDGTLDVDLLNGFIVNLGDSFVLMSFANESGQFSTLDLPHLPVGEGWLVSYNSNDVTLSVVPTPEPGSLFLFGSGLVGILGVLRCRS